jgi:hypothetical protein
LSHASYVRFAKPIMQRMPMTFPFFSGAYTVATEKQLVTMEKRMKKNVSNTRP